MMKTMNDAVPQCTPQLCSGLLSYAQACCSCLRVMRPIALPMLPIALPMLPIALPMLRIALPMRPIALPMLPIALP